jgi:hypothetical protein
MVDARACEATYKYSSSTECGTAKCCTVYSRNAELYYFM